jgi:spore maturation protein CgeB
MSSDPLKVLFVSLRWDYGDPSRGNSFEYENLWDALRRIDGIEARFFGFDEAAASVGPSGMNDELLRVAQEWKPDLVFCFLFKKEIQPETLQRLRALPGVTTLNWFADDHWRFQDFSRHWAPLFDWVATTDERSVYRYRDLGLQRVVLTQWGYNQHLAGASSQVSQLEYDVTFVGQPYGRRRDTVRRLSDLGVDARAWGEGWAQGRLSAPEMVDVFARSRINLNFADSSRTYDAATIARQLLRRRGPLVLPRFGSITSTIGQIRDARRPQIKARNFEVAGSGGLLLTEYADGLERFYELGTEIVVFRSFGDLSAKVRDLLANEEARASIALAGRERTLREHTYELRFRSLFNTIGLA